MNILLAPVGSHGDVHPFVGVGLALQARGHAITLVANEIYQTLAERHGFAFAEVGTADDFHGMTNDPLLWHPSKSLRAIFKQDLMRRLLPQTYRAIESRYEPGRTVVLAGSLGLAPRIAREKLGVPLVTIHLQPISIHSVAAPPRYPSGPHLKHFPKWMVRALYWYGEKYILDGFLAGPVNELRRDVGLPPVRRIWGAWRQSPDLILGLFPKWFATAPDWPKQMHQTGFVRYDQGESKLLPPEMERFLNEGEPPVVVSFGSAMRQGRRYFEAAAEACRRQNRRCLILAKSGEQIPPNLPPGCAQFDYAPFSLVFPRAAAVIHHGGIGTTAQCLAAGVRQFVMPLAFDQPDNAERLEKLGVARSLRAARFTADRATTILNELLADGAMPANCAAIRAKMAVDPLPETCDRIEAVSGVAG
jgi:rhamnosyltransferase subunit B